MKSTLFAAELLVAAEIVRPFPAVPTLRAVILSVAPSASAHTLFEPALINNAKHIATLPAVSPIKLTELRIAREGDRR